MLTITTDTVEMPDDATEYTDASEWPSWCDEDRWVLTDPGGADPEPAPDPDAEAFEVASAVFHGRAMFVLPAIIKPETEPLWQQTDDGDWQQVDYGEPTAEELAEGFRELEAAVAGARQVEEAFALWKGRSACPDAPCPSDAAWWSAELAHLEAQRPACEALPLTLSGLDAKIDAARRRLGLAGL
jgi:hypothetical protein